MTTHCTRTCLASHGSFRVERCSCGWISVHVGAMTLRLESAAMEQLATILGEASINNRKLQAQKDPATLGLLSPMDALDSSAEPGLGRNRACDASKKVYH